MSTPNVSGIGPEIKIVTGTPPLAQTATAVNGTGIDRLGFDSCVLDVEAGAVTGGPSAFTLDSKIQHSDASGSGYADLSGAAIPQITAASSRKRVTVNLKGAKRYVRVVTTVTLTGGTSPTCPNAAIVVLGAPDSLPAQADD